MSGVWERLMTLIVLAMGLSIGSFLNVVIARMPKGESIVRPRSRCPGCHAPIAWYDNIPVASWLWLRAKCRRCRQPISIQYPFVELLTGLLAVACFVHFGFTWATPFYFAFCAALLAVTFIDIPYQIIPNEISLPFIALGVLASLVTHQVTWYDSLIGAAVGFSLIALIAYGYFFLTRREGMGMGDAKLLAMIAAFLGWQSIPFVLLAASVQGLLLALAGIGLGIIRKAPPLPDPSEWPGGVAPEPPLEETPLRLAAVPFGPFLSLAALEFLFFGGGLLTRLQGLYH
jgi:leader peptidase (prepilin peptidase) / N-methyltransferase